MANRLSQTISLTAIVLVAFCAMAPLRGMTVVEQGRAMAVIVVPEDAIPAERTAGEELQKYFMRMSGIELEILADMPSEGNAIVVGATKLAQSLTPQHDFSQFGEDEIALLSPNEHILVIAGRRPRGTLYAVYTMLEDLGIRFWSPENETIPQKDPLILPEYQKRYAPPFGFRQANSQTSEGDRLWCVKQKLNGSMWMPPIPDEFGGYRLMNMRHTLGDDYVKPDKFFQAHPEWYAWRKSENARVPTQLCAHSQGALEELLKEIREELQRESDMEYVSISFADNNRYCECEECAKMVQEEGSAAALVLHLANQVSDNLRDDYPNLKIAMQAYWTTERPPDHMKPRDNIVVCFALLNRNHGLPPSRTPRHDVFLKKWSQLCHGNVFIWDYYATFGNFLLPMPNLDAMGYAMRTYRSFSVKGIFAQLPYGTLGEFVELRTWLFAKLAWNPDLDSKELIAEFLAGQYGAAAPWLEKYIALLEMARDRRPGTWIGCYSEGTSHWLAPQDIEKAWEYFDAALAATANVPKINKRVRGLQASLLVVSLLRYSDLRQAGIRNLPDYNEMLDKLDALGGEFVCGCYKEWAPFGEFINRMRNQKPEGAFLPRQRTDGTQIEILPDQLGGSGCQMAKADDGLVVAHLDIRQPDSQFVPWMDPAAGEISFDLPDELAGIWQVKITLRTAELDHSMPDAAYLGVYAPNEISRTNLAASPHDTTWKTIDLGVMALPPKSHIWVMPGTSAPVDWLEVKSIQLIPGKL